MENYVTKISSLKSLNYEGTNNVKALEDYAKEHNIPILRPNTASLLTSIIRLKKPKRILEIGTAIGYSGTLMLDNTLKEATLDTLEKLPENVAIANKNFKSLGFSGKVKIFEGDAKDILPTLKSGYDFIFLDGPKGQYIKYLPELVRLLDKNGTLFSDNVLYRGMVFSGQFIPRKKRAIVNNLEKFLIEVSKHDHLKTQIIDIEDGVSISIKEK